MNPLSNEIAQVARAALDYIDALPADVVARLPTMPGFDRDWAENALRKERGEAVPDFPDNTVISESTIGVRMGVCELSDKLNWSAPVGTKYYLAPPAQPVTVPELKELEAVLDWILMLPVPTQKATQMAKRLAVVIDYCRAAMLNQAPVKQPASKLRDGVASMRNSGIAVDADKIKAERDCLNYPVIPDGYALVPVEPTAEMIEATFAGEIELQSVQHQIRNRKRRAQYYRAMLAAAPGRVRDLMAIYAHPVQTVAVLDDYFSALVAAARSRADKAMRKFPQPNYVLNKVAEESGEVIKAVIHYTEGREEWANVEYEIIDNLAMLIRLVVEGDQVIGFTPPDTCRAAMLKQAPVKQPSSNEGQP